MSVLNVVGASEEEIEKLSEYITDIENWNHDWEDDVEDCWSPSGYGHYTKTVGKSASIYDLKDDEVVPDALTWEVEFAEDHNMLGVDLRDFNVVSKTLTELLEYYDVIKPIKYSGEYDDYVIDYYNIVVVVNNITITDERVTVDFKFEVQ